MNRKQTLKWCKHCNKDTHDSAQCWGPGTVTVPPFRFNEPPPFFHLLMDASRNAERWPTNDQPFCRIES